MTRYRPTVAEIDLDAIRSNVRALKPPEAELMALVKADAYGHGAVPVARAALDAGATWFGVALVEEGLELREAGIGARILVLSELPAGSEAAALTADLTPVVYTEAGVARLEAAARAAGKRDVRVHLKIDTGMHRVGVYPPEQAGEIARTAVGAGLHLEGLWTHLAKAEDEEATRVQLERFAEARKHVEIEGGPPAVVHAANSAAAALHPETHLDLVRIGAALYGIEPAPEVGTRGLKPAMTVRSEVTLVKRLPAGESISYGLTYQVEEESTIATVAIGYGDGYGRAFSSRADALVRGRRRRVAGTVTMDQVMLDCGPAGDVEMGDEVVLLGAQGEERVTADELASLAGTIGYEVVTSIGRRVPREYSG
jgi:alanine racemase